MATEGTAGGPGNGDGDGVSILLVEDNPADARLTKEAFVGAKITNRLDIVTDGEAAMGYLRQESPYLDAPRPGLVLLDLNLPRVDGKQVLRFIKTDVNLLTIPVIILTTSTAPYDLDYCYRNHANCCLVKPLKFSEFARAIEMISLFWLGLVRLPPSPTLGRTDVSLDRSTRSSGDANRPTGRIRSDETPR